ncbi:MAG: hypothetical protein JRF61_01610 [Deltaproteobacteria bacterium]|jgi:hypothetical protein|nr:hypothetical protein [Deltaproteobacteria bacterium]
MVESATRPGRGAEISERSRELVLPDDVPERGWSKQLVVAHETDPPIQADRGECGVDEPDTMQVRPTVQGADAERGVALPGDRGPRGRRSQNQKQDQRPSFWRRIAIGRRGAQSSETTETRARGVLPSPTSSRSTPDVARDVETRIVEPVLQALVSVEAKLERSHVDLIGRSDQVEQRLSQLWDIEEQLGVLGELQETLTQVSERQRRLESAIDSQDGTIRWLIGAVFASLAIAAFVVAAILR